MVSEHAKQITPQDLRQHNAEPAADAYVAVTAQLEQVQDLEEEACYLLDEGLALYEQVEGVDRERAGELVADELSGYAEEAADIAQLDDLKNEVRFADAMVQGLGHRQEDMDQHFYNGSFRHLDMEEAADTIRTNLREVKNRYVTLENTVERLEEWAANPSQYLTEPEPEKRF